MSSESKKPVGPEGDRPADSTPRTGEGASTALEAMIRKRKQVEGPEPPDCIEPQPAPP